MTGATNTSIAAVSPTTTTFPCPQCSDFLEKLPVSPPTFNYNNNTRFGTTNSSGSSGSSSGSGGSIRFTELLSTNTPPLDIERAACTSYISTTTSYLTLLSAHIAHLEGTLQRLRCAKGKTEDELGVYRKIAHPIRRVPEEILGEIFGWCVGDEASCCVDEGVLVRGSGTNANAQANAVAGSGWEPWKDLSSLDTTKPPWSLAQVSSRWRQTMLSLPSLWSHITLSAEFKHPHSPLLHHPHHHHPLTTHSSQALTEAQNLRRTRSYQTFLLGHLLSRSSNQPLTVTILAPDTIPKDHPLLPLLIPTSGRWKTLIMKTSTRSFDALAPVEGFLGTLETLILHSRGRPSPQPEEPKTLFRYAPRLRTVVTYTQFALSLALPYETIRAFRNPSVEPAQGSRTTNNLAIVGRLRWLKALKLNCRTDGGSHAVRLLPELEELELCGEESSNGVANFLSWVEAPRMKSLEIWGRVDVEGVRSFLRRSYEGINAADLGAVGLKRLVIHSHIVKTEEMVNLLETLPGAGQEKLETLEFCGREDVLVALLAELRDGSGSAASSSSSPFALDSRDRTRKGKGKAKDTTSTAFGGRTLKQKQKSKAPTVANGSHSKSKSSRTKEKKRLPSTTESEETSADSPSFPGSLLSFASSPSSGGRTRTRTAGPRLPASSSSSRFSLGGSSHGHRDHAPSAAASRPSGFFVARSVSNMHVHGTAAGNSSSGGTTTSRTKGHSRGHGHGTRPTTTSTPLRASQISSATITTTTATSRSGRNHTHTHIRSHTHTRTHTPASGSTRSSFLPGLRELVVHRHWGEPLASSPSSSSSSSGGHKITSNGGSGSGSRSAVTVNLGGPHAQIAAALQALMGSGTSAQAQVHGAGSSHQHLQHNAHHAYQDQAQAASSSSSSASFASDTDKVHELRLRRFALVRPPPPPSDSATTTTTVTIAAAATTTTTNAHANANANAASLSNNDSGSDPASDPHGEEALEMLRELKKLRPGLVVRVVCEGEDVTACLPLGDNYEEDGEDEEDEEEEGEGCSEWDEGGDVMYVDVDGVDHERGDHEGEDEGMSDESSQEDEEDEEDEEQMQVGEGEAYTDELDDHEEDDEVMMGLSVGEEGDDTFVEGMSVNGSGSKSGPIVIDDDDDDL
jgi:hypothetical protein